MEEMRRAIEIVDAKTELIAKSIDRLVDAITGIVAP